MASRWPKKKEKELRSDASEQLVIYLDNLETMRLEAGAMEALHTQLLRSGSVLLEERGAKGAAHLSFMRPSQVNLGTQQDLELIGRSYPPRSQKSAH
eukprot:7464646-Pyramimonas_sp.AAC.1